MIDMPNPSPLVILVETMREKWNQGDRDAAVAIAKIVAPYFHPRAASCRSMRPVKELQRLDDAELADRIADAREQIGLPRRDPGPVG